MFPPHKLSVGIERLLHHRNQLISLNIIYLGWNNLQVERWLIVISFQKSKDLFMLNAQTFGVM
jgi:hypothetical protein